MSATASFRTNLSFLSVLALGFMLTVMVAHPTAHPSELSQPAAQAVCLASSSH